MEEKVKNINSLITAFETRNEILNEEIKKNMEAIKKMEAELNIINDNSFVKDKDNKVNDTNTII